MTKKEVIEYIEHVTWAMASQFNCGLNDDAETAKELKEVIDWIEANCRGSLSQSKLPQPSALPQDGASEATSPSATSR